MFRLLIGLIEFIISETNESEMDSAIKRARRNGYAHRNTGGVRLKLLPKCEEASCTGRKS